MGDLRRWEWQSRKHDFGGAVSGLGGVQRVSDLMLIPEIVTGILIRQLSEMIVFRIKSSFEMCNC